MGYLLAGFAVLGAGFFFLRWIANAPPHQIRKGLGYGLSGALILGALFLFTRGAIAPALGLLSLAIPPLIRSAGWFSKSQPTDGQHSDVKTNWLSMTLDHDSGVMSGTILKGDRKGQTLDSLDDAALLALLDQLDQEDPESARLLQSWIARMRPHMTGAYDGEDEGTESQDSGPYQGGNMDRQEALSVLGLEGNPDDATIRAAWKRMIAHAHPDQGGSAWMAARVNQARDILLGSRS